MRYKGFYIKISPDINISRVDKNGRDVLCEGFLIQVFADETERVEIDSFSAAVRCLGGKVAGSVYIHPVGDHRQAPAQLLQGIEIGIRAGHARELIDRRPQEIGADGLRKLQTVKVAVRGIGLVGPKEIGGLVGVQDVLA